MTRATTDGTPIVCLLMKLSSTINIVMVVRTADWTGAAI